MEKELIDLPAFIFITGLSSAGKTTLARNLVREIQADLSKSMIVVDGTDLFENSILFPFDGHELLDRSERSKHLMRLLKWLNSQGFVCLIPIIGQPISIREDWSILGEHIEIHLSCEVEICRARDDKNVYSKQEDNAILGQSLSYESPENSYLNIRSDEYDSDKICSLVIKKLNEDYRFS